MAATLNLSNEVVKMRAEVKRVKVMVIRKLIRHIDALKKRKGTPADLEKNQRRAARLIEEIREIRALVPDSITKTALQQDISFEKVCQKKDASLTERATARIASYPDFSKRIQNLKNAIRSFKQERISAAKAEKKKAEKDPKGIVQQKRDSEHESDDEKGAESSEDEEDREQVERKNENEEDNDASTVVKKDDTQVMKETAKQNDDSTEEKSSETGNTPAEVVRMRKEVKKLRVLIIRKLTQQITSLRKMKADKTELKENQERAARLQKELQVLRGLSPDHVTKTAIQGDISVEKVLEDPKSTPLERVTARIATHPRFIKKLQDVQEAIKEERTKAAQADQKDKERDDYLELTKDEDSDGEVEDSDVEDEEGEEENITGTGDDDDGGDDDDDDDDDDDIDNDNDDDTDDKKRMGEDRTLNIPSCSPLKPAESTKPAAVIVPLKEKLPTKKSKEAVTKQAVKDSANQKRPFVAAKALQGLPSRSKETPLTHDIKPDTKKTVKGVGEEESDLDLSDADEEKEYFDDSTEERFHKQSSLSEASDDDDFFIGKVSKLKKKKSDAAPREEKKSDPDKKGKSEDGEKEISERSKAFKMQSVFCSTLSKSSGAPQKGKGMKGPPRFQNQRQGKEGDEKPTWFKSQGPGSDKRPSEFNNQRSGPKGAGPKQRGAAVAKTGKPAFERQQFQSGKGAAGKFSSRPQQSQQALHPSWEASKKRKEQMSQITAFQGKKIKFDDD